MKKYSNISHYKINYYNIQHIQDSCFLVITSKQCTRPSVSRQDCCHIYLVGSWHQWTQAHIREGIVHGQCHRGEYSEAGSLNRWTYWRSSKYMQKYPLWSVTLKNVLQQFRICCHFTHSGNCFTEGKNLVTITSNLFRIKTLPQIRRWKHIVKQRTVFCNWHFPENPRWCPFEQVCQATKSKEKAW